MPLTVTRKPQQIRGIALQIIRILAREPLCLFTNAGRDRERGSRTGCEREGCGVAPSWIAGARGIVGFVLGHMADRHEATRKVVWVPQKMPEIERLEHPRIEYRAAHGDRRAGRPGRRVDEHGAMLAGHRGARQCLAHLLQILAGEDRKSTPARQCQRRIGVDPGSVDSRPVEGNAPIGMADEPSQ